MTDHLHRNILPTDTTDGVLCRWSYARKLVTA